MLITRISRVVVFAAALLFAGTGLAIWISPAQAAGRFGLEAARASGAISLRADLGGLFVGLALMCIAALSTGRRSWSLAAAAVLGAIAMGRTIGWIRNGGPAGDAMDLAIELAVMAALAMRAASPDLRRHRAGTGRAVRPECG